MVEQVEIKLKAKKFKNILLPTQATMATTIVAKKRRGEGENTIEKAFNMEPEIICMR